MPQDIRVVKCFSCNIYQTDIVKKAHKWRCKVCGIKQSCLQEYCRGTGKVCREYAQKMNEKKVSTDEAYLELATFIQENASNSGEMKCKDASINKTASTSSSNTHQETSNKWLAYVDKDDETDAEHDFNIHF